MAGRGTNSLETILTYENRDLRQWSVQWSTTHIPGMDNASGRPRSHELGRRRLRLGSLVLGGLLTMHCRVAASALTGGLFLFLLLLITGVAALASPMRYFEVYLGQWSISGPGRSFRIIPMFDGIGIAICINAIVRAINCCFIAAIATLYITHSVSNAELPFTYCRFKKKFMHWAAWWIRAYLFSLKGSLCPLYLLDRNSYSRDFTLKAYTPAITDMKLMMLQESTYSMEPRKFVGGEEHQNHMFSTTVGLFPNAWRNVTFGDKKIGRLGPKIKLEPHQMAVCKEQYSDNYPVLYSTPAYNFFYVEIVHLRDDHNIAPFNIPLVICNILIWCTIWALMISERFRYGKLIWNNIFIWFVIIPVIWALVLSTAAICSLLDMKKTFRKLFRVGAKELLAAIADALEVALYIHSAGVGTEIIHGKGLNHYASGHIDPHLNAENIWHSVLLLVMSGLHCIGAALCALVDSNHLKTSSTYNMGESTLWIIPMYSKCSSLGNYSHLLTTLIFGGLVFSYMAVAFILLKTALHTIFEYRVKLVFVEQLIVGALILACMGLSLPFASNGGIALLESVDALMCGIATAFVCLLELFGLLYVYRAHDFISDMNLSQEDSTCPTRIEWQWQMLPFISLVTIFLKALKLAQAEMPKKLMYIALAPVAGVALAVPLRALHNAIVFLSPTPRRGT